MKFDYTSDLTENMNTRRVRAEGIYPVIITAAKAKVGDKKLCWPRVDLTMLSLKDQNDPTSGDPKTRSTFYLVFPFINEEAIDDSQPETSRAKANNSLKFLAERYCETLRALLGEEILQAPTRVEGKWYFQDREIDKDEVAGCQAEADKAALDLMQELFDNDGQLLVNCTAYCDMKLDGSFLQAGRIMDKVPNNKTLVDPDKWYTEVSFGEFVTGKK